MPIIYYGKMGILGASAAMNVATMAAPQSTDTAANKLSNTDQKKRLELLTYVKAHLDLIAVTMLVSYLGYSLYQMHKKGIK
jgi:hypothetical protein